MKKLLLHACCAPCSAYVFQELQKEFEVSFYFYNPNIWPGGEYEKRKTECKRYCKKSEIEFVEEVYDPQKWALYIEGLENEPEGGKRCEKCFELRLLKSAKYAKNHGFDQFATTLTISPHKNSGLINEIGKKVANQVGTLFYEADWKKEDGYKKSCDISKKESFYRQNYCGCQYSKR